MENKPLISVIVPVYNILDLLPRCVHSITAQTFRDIEVILVDDGSTDGTGALCDELAKEDVRIRVFHKENGGSSSARNLAIANAKGEYFGFVDSDDYIEPDMYERLYEGLRTYNVQIAQIGRNEIDARGNLLPDICIPPTEPECISSRDFMRELLMHRGDCSYCTKLVHRSLFAENVFPEGVLNEDFHLLIRMLSLTDRVLSLPGYAYHVFYRIGSNSRKATRNEFSRVYGDCVNNADLATEVVKHSFPGLEEEALRFNVFQRLEYLLHIPIGLMNSGNEMYREIVRYMRVNWIAGLQNTCLTRKNKIYHTLFALAPATLRRVHKLIRGKKIENP